MLGVNLGLLLYGDVSVMKTVRRNVTFLVKQTNLTNKNRHVIKQCSNAFCLSQIDLFRLLLLLLRFLTGLCMGRWVKTSI